jgi:hypothetical protein
MISSEVGNQTNDPDRNREDEHFPAGRLVFEQSAPEFGVALDVPGMFENMIRTEALVTFLSLGRHTAMFVKPVALPELHAHRWFAWSSFRRPGVYQGILDSELVIGPETHVVNDDLLQCSRSDDKVGLVVLDAIFIPEQILCYPEPDLTP